MAMMGEPPPLSHGAIERMLGVSTTSPTTLIVKQVDDGGGFQSSLRVWLADQELTALAAIEKAEPIFQDMIRSQQLVAGAMLRILRWGVSLSGTNGGPVLLIHDAQYLGACPEVLGRVANNPLYTQAPSTLRPLQHNSQPSCGGGTSAEGLQTPPPTRRLGSGDVSSDVKTYPFGAPPADSETVQQRAATSAKGLLAAGDADSRVLFAESRGIDEEPSPPATQPGNIYSALSFRGAESSSQMAPLSARMGTDRVPQGFDFRMSRRVESHRPTVARADEGVVPISALSPYVSRWRIKARVTSKGDIRKFNNSRGEGQFFKIELQDSSGPITGTFFGKAVPVNFPRLQQSKVYYFSRGAVKPANKKFDKGDFVLTFDEHTVIEETSDDVEIPGTSYTFLPLHEVQSQDVNASVDVAGILVQVREAVMVMLRSGPQSGQERPKRDVVLWDGSNGGSLVELTLWGDKAHMDFTLETIVFVKNAVVREWQGRFSLGSGSSTCIEFSPDHRKAIELMCTWQEKGKPGLGEALPAAASAGSGSSTAHAELIEQVLERSLSLGAPGDGNASSRHTVLGILTKVNLDKPPFYPACPELVEKSAGALTQAFDSQGGPGESAVPKRTCNKKMTQEPDGTWRCAAQHCHAAPTYRYLCRLQLNDGTGSLEVQAFDEAGLKLFGAPATEVALAWEVNGDHSWEVREKIGRPLWQPSVLKLRAQKETYNSEERIKYAVVDTAPISVVSEARRRLQEVRSVLGAF